MAHLDSLLMSHWVEAEGTGRAAVLTWGSDPPPSSLGTGSIHVLLSVHVSSSIFCSPDGKSPVVRAHITTLGWPG